LEFLGLKNNNLVAKIPQLVQMFFLLENFRTFKKLINFRKIPQFGTHDFSILEF
jgi:hypothetical protein